MNAPETIKLHRQSQVLEVGFADANFLLPAEYLRVFSPSAEVKGHGPGQEILQLNKQHVGITQVQAQGNYAVKLTFDDGHDSGIYSWSYLRELGEHQRAFWQDYLDRVETHKQVEEEQQTTAVKWLEPE